MADNVDSPDALTEDDARQRIVRVVQLVADNEVTLVQAARSIATISKLAGHSPEWGFSLRDHPALKVTDH